MTFRTHDESTVCLDCGSPLCQKHRLSRALELAGVAAAATFGRIGEEAFIDDEKNNTLSVEAIGNALGKEIGECMARARERNRREL